MQSTFAGSLANITDFSYFYRVNNESFYNPQKRSDYLGEVKGVERNPFHNSLYLDYKIRVNDNPMKHYDPYRNYRRKGGWLAPTNYNTGSGQ